MLDHILGASSKPAKYRVTSQNQHNARRNPGEGDHFYVIAFAQFTHPAWSEYLLKAGQEV